MSSPDEPDLADAYAVETPDDNRALYREWADSYESGFMVRRGYVYHEHVARLFVERGGAGPVLDVGCGTGVVGVELAAAGIDPIDGLDISPDMLAQAAEKRTADNGPVYRQLMEADLTQPIALADAAYAGIVSSGTFTHGHVGPSALGELFRVAAPGAVAAIGINAEHFSEHGFAARFDQAIAAGDIEGLELIEVPVYAGGDDEYADTTALIAVYITT